MLGMTGEDWIPVILGIIAATQVLGLAYIQRGKTEISAARKEVTEARKEDKAERAHVAEEVVKTATAAEATHKLAEKTHTAVNSNFTALKDELRTSNEHNAHLRDALTAALQKLGLDSSDIPQTPASSLLASSKSKASE